MKRSEMKIKIKDAIKSCYQGPAVIPDYVLEAILEACEENGMLPPYSETQFQKAVRGQTKSANEWDPE